MPKSTALEDDASLVPDGTVLRAILAILVAEREERQSEEKVRRSELVLSDVGIDHRDIASLLGKKPDAVRMLVTRAKRAGGKATD